MIDRRHLTVAAVIAVPIYHPSKVAVKLVSLSDNQRTTIYKCLSCCCDTQNISAGTECARSLPITDSLKLSLVYLYLHIYHPKR